MNNNRRVFVTSIFAGAALVLAARGLNVLTFEGLSAVPGSEWISLPAGTRLLIALVLGEAGLIGVMIGSWCIAFLIHGTAHPFRVFFCGIAAAVTSPLAMRLSGQHAKLANALEGLTPSGLLGLIVINAALGPVLRITLCIFSGDLDYLPSRLGLMFLGDLAGSLAVVYALKIMLHWVALPKPPAELPQSNAQRGIGK
ncbi:hypothetical protein [Robbsia sp. KACC 23696]|uniref:hypothetical protein n=1 Tax=Robbsia sp. KACC 23696 TaxID=3149231 RepID=UPI00325B483D